MRAASSSQSCCVAGQLFSKKLAICICDKFAMSCSMMRGQVDQQFNMLLG